SRAPAWPGPERDSGRGDPDSVSPVAVFFGRRSWGRSFGVLSDEKGAQLNQCERPCGEPKAKPARLRKGQENRAGGTPLPSVTLKVVLETSFITDTSTWRSTRSWPRNAMSPMDRRS